MIRGETSTAADAGFHSETNPELYELFIDSDTRIQASHSLARPIYKQFCVADLLLGTQHHRRDRHRKEEPVRCLCPKRSCSCRLGGSRGPSDSSGDGA